MLEDTVTELEDCPDVGVLEGSGGRDSGAGPGPIMVLSISELMCSAMFLLSSRGSPGPASGELELRGWRSWNLGSTRRGLAA